MKTVTVEYVGETKQKANLTDKNTGKILPESTVTVPPPKKSYDYYDHDQQRQVGFKAKFHKEGGGWFSHGVPVGLAEILDRSPNYKIIKGAAPKKADPKPQAGKVKVLILESFKIGKNEVSAGKEKSFKKSYAEKLIAEGKAVAA